MGDKLKEKNMNFEATTSSYNRFSVCWYVLFKSLDFFSNGVEIWWRPQQMIHICVVYPHMYSAFSFNLLPL